MKLKILILSLVIFTFYSCKDENIINTSPLTSIQPSRDHLIAEYMFNDIRKIVEDAFINNFKNTICPIYSINNINQVDQDTIIIDFGNENTICPPIYGNIRSGKIIVVYMGNYRDSLASITTTFDNFRINNQLIQGQQHIINEGRNTIGNMWFTVNITNAVITTSNGNIDWQSNQTRELMSGQSTVSNIFDDRYIVSGFSSGNSVNGNDFNVSITVPLMIDQECLLTGKCSIKNGVAKISINNQPDRTINYGDSICDCNIDVLIDNQRYPIVIN